MDVINIWQNAIRMVAAQQATQWGASCIHVWNCIYGLSHKSVPRSGKQFGVKRYVRPDHSNHGISWRRTVCNSAAGVSSCFFISWRWQQTWRTVGYSNNIGYLFGLRFRSDHRMQSVTWRLLPKSPDGINNLSSFFPSFPSIYNSSVSNMTVMLCVLIQMMQIMFMLLLMLFM